MTDLVLTRDVTPEECDWLHRTFTKGEHVVLFTGATYGCVAPNGIAASVDGKNPFFELPLDAVEVVR